MPESKYSGLDMSPIAAAILYNNPTAFAKCCNGVGSQTGWVNRAVYHFIPNTIWLLNITPASDIHDVEYTYPETFETTNEAMEWKRRADNRFRDNLFYLIERETSWEWLKRRRRFRAIIYYRTVRAVGAESFISGKTIETDKNTIAPHWDT